MLRKILLLLLFILIAVIIILGIYSLLDNVFGSKFIQISKNDNTNYLVIPSITSVYNQACSKWSVFPFDLCKLSLLDSSSGSFFLNCPKGQIVVNTPGLYEISFSISGFININIPETNPELNTTDDPDTAVDYNIEWSIDIDNAGSDPCRPCRSNTQVIIPAFSNNRTTGPENLNTFNKIVNITSVPAFLGVNYRLLERNAMTVHDYHIDNFVFYIKKV